MLDDVGDDDAPGLAVFVHVDPERINGLGEQLGALGVGGRLQGGIGTATLSANQVRELSDQPWVRQVRLATPLHLLE